MIVEVGGIGVTINGLKLESLAARLIGGGAGCFIPELALSVLKRGLQEKIFMQLPDALDLLVVCVEAGLGWDSGMRRVSE
ncbi:MAG: hypothetical protein FJ302_02185 [Planctomycetes bacterium]|nr:hypothetical protein [Planctomycetota bacterium]